jgi:hypothetical protein
MSPRPDDLPTPDAARLIAGLVAARVLDPGRTAAVVAECRDEAAGGEPEPAHLFDHLVRRRLLTAFQAEQALAGHTAGLTVGPYRLVEPVGEDAWGTVYTAHSPADDRRYAVRVFAPRGPGEVLRGVTGPDALRHPAVVPLAAVGTAAGRHYLAWPFADGESLEHSVRRVGPLGPADAARVFADLADGLAACHAAGVAHGLVRPAAILLGLDRKPRLLDLGLAAVLAENGFDHQPSPHPAADARGFALALHYALTGLAPADDPAPVRSRAPQVPAAVADLLDGIIRNSASDRPTDLRAVAGELRAAAEAAAEAHADGAVFASFRPGPRVRRADSPDQSGFVDFDSMPAPPPDGPEGGPPPPAPLSVPEAHASTLRAGGDGTIQVGKSERPSRAIPAPVNLGSGRTSAGAAARRPPVALPEPPLFARTPVKAARSLLFWKRPTDPVLLSAFGPPAIAPGQRVRFLVYAHRAEAFDGVATLCRALHAGADLLGAGYIDRPVPRGTEVGLHLALANAGVAKSLLTFTWTGQTQPRTFEVFVPWESPPGLASGVLSAGVGDARVAAVPVQFEVVPRSG